MKTISKKWISLFVAIMLAVTGSTTTASAFLGFNFPCTAFIDVEPFGNSGYFIERVCVACLGEGNHVEWHWCGPWTNNGYAL